ncbi:MAG: HNH endonuclease [Planctomycetota bacterium]
MLNEPVLILNRSWLPLQVGNVRRSILLLYKGVAEVVCPYTFQTFDFERWKQQSLFNADRSLATPYFRLRLPEVIVLTAFNTTIRRRIRFNRRNVMTRDNHTCQYCGRKLTDREITLEHVRPVSRGGDHTWENVVLACPMCNKRKGDRTPEQAGMRLLRMPRRPHALFATAPRVPRIRVAWQPFFSHAHKTRELIHA